MFVLVVFFDVLAGNNAAPAAGERSLVLSLYPSLE
jgi:hypothetical protein